MKQRQVQTLRIKLSGGEYGGLCTQGAIRSDRYRALVRDMQKVFFIFSFLFKKAFACPLPLDRGF